MPTLLVHGHPLLETPCTPVAWPDPDLAAHLAALHQALASFRREPGVGRAIAAPQLGIPKRIIAVNLGATPFAVINPEVTWRSPEQVEVWDDCPSVPDDVVRVRRHCSISLQYLDAHGRLRHWHHLSADVSELLQHEIDHLDGVLMTEKAVDEESVRPIAEHPQLVASSRPVYRLSLQAIAEATQSIDPIFLHSPQYECEPLSEALGCRLTLKLESCNPIRSFKGRGADYFVSRAVQAGDIRPMVCASAGNFGQALAYACRNHNRSLIVYASTCANVLKVERMRGLGAEVRLQGDDFDAAKAAAKAYCEATGAWMVEDGLETAISEGAGSIGVELLARQDAFDAVTIPLGNGALLNGVARWLKAASPATQVLGVCSLGADAMEKSWRSGRFIQRPDVSTIADGIGIRVPIAEALDDMRDQVDEVRLVSDDHIIAAMRLLYEHAGLLIEPAGAAGVAVLVAEPDRFHDQHIATVLCGSNLTQVQIEEWLINERKV